jgi:hypothetical protein
MQALQATEEGKEEHSQDRQPPHEANIGQMQKEVTLRKFSGHLHTSLCGTVANTRTRHTCQPKLDPRRRKLSRRKMSSYVKL